MALGVMAMGSIPRETEKKGQGEVGLVLEMAGLTVKPGDFIYADGTGVIVSDKALL